MYIARNSAIMVIVYHIITATFIPNFISVPYRCKAARMVITDKIIPAMDANIAMTQKPKKCRNYSLKYKYRKENVSNTATILKLYFTYN